MRIEIDIPEHQYNNIMAFDSVNLGRVPYKGIIMYAINAIKHGRVLEQEPTTKNDSKFCPDRKVKTTNMETILHCIENECAAYKDGKCLKYNSDQEPTTKNDLRVEEVTALAEWIAKLTEECENAYNKGYADGMKAQAEPKTGHWININVDGFLYHKIYKCSHCGDTVCEHPENIQKYKYCSNCGADMRWVEE